MREAYIISDQMKQILTNASLRTEKEIFEFKIGNTVALAFVRDRCDISFT